MSTIAWPIGRLRDAARKQKPKTAYKVLVEYKGKLYAPWNGDFVFKPGQWMFEPHAKMCQSGFHTFTNLSEATKSLPYVKNNSDFGPPQNGVTYGIYECTVAGLSGTSDMRISKPWCKLVNVTKQLHHYIKIGKKVL